jgi:dihydroneopterin aldolase/2-amino-4-hydroxy-6-hydroxymethyldihydropteridine diphosphokinase
LYDEARGVAFDASGRRLDQIRLSGISATGYHGVFEHERRDGQTFVADVVVHLDTRRAAAGDDLGHTLHYGELAEQVAAVLAGDPVDLIETVAERIAATVLAHGIVQAVDVAVHKPQAPIQVPFGDVVVAIHRDRSKLPAAEPYVARAATGASSRPVPNPTATFPITADSPATGSATVGPVLPGSGPLPPSGPVTVRPAPSGVLAGGLAGQTVGGPVGGPVGAPVGGFGGPDVDSPATVVAAGTEMAAWNAPLPPVPLGAGPDADDDVVEGEVLTDALDTPPTSPVDVVLAIGANIGAAQDTLRQAVSDLAGTPGVEVVDVSPLARTAPVGGPEQPDFLNAVVLARTTLSPRDLLRATQAVEQAHGRERHEHWGPRTLDVDIVVYGTVLATSDDLELPHPRAHERAFVLQPWAQVDPDAFLPGLGGGPVAALAATAPDRDGVRWLALDWLTAAVPAANPAPPVGADQAEPGVVPPAPGP